MCEKCIQCGNDVLIIDTKKFPKKFCSYSCYEHWNKFNKPSNCECVVCGIKMYMKKSRLDKAKNGITCSKECANVLKSSYMQGENNHQYGLVGELNSSFKGEELEKSNYNIVDILVYTPNHPFKRSDNRVKKHRLIVEENYKLFNSDNFIVIDGNYFLKPELDVHHINGNHSDNSIENLEPITRGNHTSIHNKEKEIIRDNLGRIIGVVKLSNIGEGCDANPEINSEITKGSESSYSVEGE